MSRAALAPPRRAVIFQLLADRLGDDRRRGAPAAPLRARGRRRGRASPSTAGNISRSAATTTSDSRTIRASWRPRSTRPCATGSGRGFAPAERAQRGARASSNRRSRNSCGCPAALHFSSGYQANIGAITALAGPEDAVFSDELNHASLIDGARLSRAQRRALSARRSSISLDKALASSAERSSVVVTDGVFSMDGDIAPVAGAARALRAPRRPAGARRRPRLRRSRPAGTGHARAFRPELAADRLRRNAGQGGGGFGRVRGRNAGSRSKPCCSGPVPMSTPRPRRRCSPPRSRRACELIRDRGMAARAPARGSSHRSSSSLPRDRSQALGHARSSRSSWAPTRPRSHASASAARARDPGARDPSADGSRRHGAAPHLAFGGSRRAGRLAPARRLCAKRAPARPRRTPSRGARGFFVTGTDTGVGKTLVACALLRAFAVGRQIGRWA